MPTTHAYTIIRRTDSTMVNIHRDGQPFITDIPEPVAVEFCEHPGKFTDVFLDAPKLRAIALAREMVWTLQT